MANSSLLLVLICAAFLVRIRGCKFEFADDTSFLFGYGSLMHSGSRNKTAMTHGMTLPVRVKGLQRSWNTQAENSTVVGVELNKTAVTNGLLVVVTQKELERFDDREKYYNRREILRKDITVFPGFDTPNMKNCLDGKNVYTYVLKPKRSGWTATKGKQISQSYTDVILAACLSISDTFANECIQFTKRWSPHRIDDRLKPIEYDYLKDMVNATMRGRIDKLMQ
eukprot:936706_1